MEAEVWTRCLPWLQAPCCVAVDRNDMQYHKRLVQVSTMRSAILSRFIRLIPMQESLDLAFVRLA